MNYNKETLVWLFFFFGYRAKKKKRKQTGKEKGNA